MVTKLNEELTSILFSSKFFDANGWDKFQGLVKEAFRKNYKIHGIRFDYFTEEEHQKINLISAILCDIMLFDAERIISTQSMDYLDAETLEEIIEDSIESLNNNNYTPTKPISFFKRNGRNIELKCFDAFHIYDKVWRAIEKCWQ